MAKLPGIRELEIYIPLEWRCPPALERARHQQRNKVAFDSASALGAALDSPVRRELRAAFARFPPYRGRGTILFTGASGSLRGSPNFAAFAAAKGGLRFMAQSMARELGPKGIHVATVLLDGAIDSPMVWREHRERMEKLGADGAIDPDAVAEAYWQLHAQPRNAWTFELDLRPWTQPW